jgi:hypothetical protein
MRMIGVPQFDEDLTAAAIHAADYVAFMPLRSIADVDGERDESAPGFIRVHLRAQ